MLSKRVAQWLEGISDVSEVRPVTLTIGRQVYHGARYIQRDSEGFYLVGTLPASYLRRKHTVYRFADDPRDWYIGCYWDGRPGQFPLTKAQLKKYHPFGVSFNLFPWDSPLGPIDFGARFAYRRVPVTAAY